MSQGENNANGEIEQNVFNTPLNRWHACDIVVSKRIRHNRQMLHVQVYK